MKLSATVQLKLSRVDSVETDMLRGSQRSFQCTRTHPRNSIRHLPFWLSLQSNMRHTYQWVSIPPTPENQLLRLVNVALLESDTLGVTALPRALDLADLPAEVDDWKLSNNTYTRWRMKHNSHFLCQHRFAYQAVELLLNPSPVSRLSSRAATCLRCRRRGQKITGLAVKTPIKTAFFGRKYG